MASRERFVARKPYGFAWLSGVSGRTAPPAAATIEPRQIDAPFVLLLDQLQPRFEPFDAPHQLRHELRRLVDLGRPRHLGIAQDGGAGR